MTHEELLFKSVTSGDTSTSNALRAVVELHNPINNPNFPDSDIWCWQCADGRGYAKYPCPTIQAIEKELN